MPESFIQIQGFQKEMDGGKIGMTECVEKNQN